VGLIMRVALPSNSASKIVSLAFFQSQRFILMTSLFMSGGFVNISFQTMPPTSNIPVKAAPSGRWTLRDKAPRSAPYLQRWAAASPVPRARSCARHLPSVVLPVRILVYRLASVRSASVLVCIPGGTPLRRDTPLGQQPASNNARKSVLSCLTFHVLSGQPPND